MEHAGIWVRITPLLPCTNPGTEEDLYSRSNQPGESTGQMVYGTQKSFYSA